MPNIYTYGNLYSNITGMFSALMGQTALNGISGGSATFGNGFNTSTTVTGTALAFDNAPEGFLTGTVTELGHVSLDMLALQSGQGFQYVNVLTIAGISLPAESLFLYYGMSGSANTGQFDTTYFYDYFNAQSWNIRGDYGPDVVIANWQMTLDGNDTIRLGDGNDSIDAGGGDDRLFGEAGDDDIVGGAGNDRLDGGAGADYLGGGDGSDTLLGGDGEDRLDGGDNNDRLVGGAGNDWLWGAGGHDRLLGNDGDDTIYGDEGNDVIRAGNDHDLAYGEAGDDLVIGGTGRDTLYGDEGNDTLRGTGGFDTVRGGEGDDSVFGGAQADLVMGEDGNDTVAGGGGFDTIDGGFGDDVLTGNFNADQFHFHNLHGNDTITDFEATNDNEVIDISAIPNIHGIEDLELDSATTGAAIQMGADVLIMTSDESSILLQGVSLADLDANDFVFWNPG